MALMEARLKPIAQRPIGFSSLKDPQSLLRPQSPLDEAGLRPQAEALLARLQQGYVQGDETQRQAIRALFVKHPSVAWAMPFALPLPFTPEAFRLQLLLFSMLDQGSDSRDAILALQALCSTARSGGVDVVPILQEVAALSSEMNRYGMGSTRGMLLGIERME